MFSFPLFFLFSFIYSSCVLFFYSPPTLYFSSSSSFLLCWSLPFSFSSSSNFFFFSYSFLFVFYFSPSTSSFPLCISYFPIPFSFSSFSFTGKDISNIHRYIFDHSSSIYCSYLGCISSIIQSTKVLFVQSFHYFLKLFIFLSCCRKCLLSNPFLRHWRIRSISQL